MSTLPIVALITLAVGFTGVIRFTELIQDELRFRKDNPQKWQPSNEEFLRWMKFRLETETLTIVFLVVFAVGVILVCITALIQTAILHGWASSKTFWFIVQVIALALVLGLGYLTQPKAGKE